MKLVGKDQKQEAVEQARNDALSILMGEIASDKEVEIGRACREVPAYQEEFLETSRMMASLEGLSTDPDVCVVLNKYPSPRKSSRTWPKLTAAAGVLIAIVVSWFMVSQPPVEKTQIDRYVTRVGEQREVELADGSMLALNTGTVVLVEMADDTRRIILERGEAFFDVAKDPQRPFTVVMGGRSVSVLGTKFNILRSPDQFTLAVVEGAVSVHDTESSDYVNAPLLKPTEGERLQLSAPGQRKVNAGTVVEYDFDADRLAAYSDTHIGHYQQWRTGMLSFKNEPLSKVVQELNRYSAKKILLESSQLMDREIYATIRIDQISMALEGLENSLPIKVITHFDRIVITEKNK